MIIVSTRVQASCVLIVTNPEMLAFDALRLMEDRPSQINVLPVVDDKSQCVGLIRLHDIVRSGL